MMCLLVRGTAGVCMVGIVWMNLDLAWPVLPCGEGHACHVLRPQQVQFSVDRGRALVPEHRRLRTTCGNGKAVMVVRISGSSVPACSPTMFTRWKVHRVMTTKCTVDCMLW